MSELSGHTIGPYRLVERLGEGGMSEVYKAFQSRLDRYVALKFIRPELAAEEGFQPRFEQEAKILARLSHPNIVHIYDYGEERNRCYFVMEYINGSTLKDRLRALSEAQETMGLEEALQITRQVSAALDYAHEQSIIHRDVKPANVMLTPDGRAMLNDFGIAKIVGAASGITRTGASIGTPDYMSPEQITGDTAKIGPASDVYALGVVLYEMVIGRVPFTADTPIAVMLKHLADPIPLPRSLNPELPEAVERVILKALAKDPTDRYQSAGELTQALQAAISATPPPTLIRPAPPTIPEARQPVWWPKVYKAWPGMLVLLFILVVAIMWVRGAQEVDHDLAAVSGSLTLTAQERPTTITAARDTAIPIGTSAQPTRTAVATDRASAMPVETGLVSIVSSFSAPGRRTEGITWDGTYLWISDNSGTIFQADTSGITLGAFQSPEVTPKGLAWDGTSIWVFTTNYLRIYRFQIEGRETKTISSFESPASVFGGSITNDLTWDGEDLWYANQYNVYELDTSGEIVSSFAFPKNVSGLDWDGSSLWIAYNDFPSNSTLVVVDTEGNILGSFASPISEIEGLAWGDEYLWAVGRDSLGGESMIYKLDVSSAIGTIKRFSDTTWQAQVLSVRESFFLEEMRFDNEGVPRPFQYLAGEGRIFVIIELGLKNKLIDAVLYPEDISIIDDEGRKYYPAGIQKSAAPMPDEFAIGTLTGTITMSNLEPPLLTLKYIVERVVDSNTITTQFRMPLSASDGEWPGLILIWRIPVDAKGLRIAVPGATAVELGEL